MISRLALRAFNSSLIVGRRHVTSSSSYFSATKGGSSDESSTSTPPKPDVHSTITPQIDQSLDVNPLTGKPRVISKELQKGAFHMLKDINQNKGKVFIGERVGEGGSVMTWPEIEGLINLNDAPPTTFPPPSPTLIAVSFKQFGFDMLSSWLTPLSPSTPTLQLVIGDGGILKLFRGFLSSSLKKVISEKNWKNTYMFNGDHSLIRDRLKIENTLTGYVFYVVGGKVVWRGCGVASEGELEDLKEVIREHGGGGGGGGGERRGKGGKGKGKGKRAGW
ncbi:hypothetical protein TrLO_g12143 [Triparma laevis f. longispina]|uniref:Uncharacterized protein n=1 Tax=Triparma laevis f. longispina TaxID=1714387 RepID=A0A9W7KYX6_9STRA|nr:hypothetical protein TrLO_g12143 [Triparma laevis f. longispina]